MKYVLSACLGYLIGSLSMSIILTKYIYKDDVRNHGSGNAGATNVARTFGWGPGLLTLLCDFAKCALSLLLGRRLCGEPGFMVAGIACLIGHCYPLYFDFRGGKAVATGICVAFLTDWRFGLTALVVFVLVAAATKYVSLASVSGALSTIIALFFFDITPEKKVLLLFTVCQILFMHRSNLKRLCQGTETKFSAGKRKKE